jgi:hypothetical protein
VTVSLKGAGVSSRAADRCTRRDGARILGGAGERPDDPGTTRESYQRSGRGPRTRGLSGGRRPGGSAPAGAQASKTSATRSESVSGSGGDPGGGLRRGRAGGGK